MAKAIDHQAKIDEMKAKAIYAITQEYGKYAMSPGILDMLNKIDVSYVDSLPHGWSGSASPETLNIKLTDAGWGVSYGDILHEMIHMYSEIAKTGFDRYNFLRTGEVKKPKIGFATQVYNPSTEKTETVGRAINEGFTQLYTSKLASKYEMPCNPETYLPHVKICQNLESILGKDLLEKAFFSDMNDSAVSQKFDNILGKGSWNKLVTTMDNFEYDKSKVSESISEINNMIMDYHILSKQQDKQLQKAMGIGSFKQDSNMQLRDNILNAVLRHNLAKDENFIYKDLSVCNIANASIQKFESKNTFMVSDKQNNIFQFTSIYKDENSKMHYQLHEPENISDTYDFKTYTMGIHPEKINKHDEKIYKAIHKQYAKDESSGFIGKIKSRFAGKQDITIKTFADQDNEFAVVYDKNDKSKCKIYDVTSKKVLGREVIKPKSVELDKETKTTPVEMSKQTKSQTYDYSRSKEKENVRDLRQPNVPTAHRTNSQGELSY